jgi:uncharacterized protein YacL
MSVNKIEEICHSYYRNGLIIGLAIGNIIISVLGMLLIFDVNIQIITSIISIIITIITISLFVIKRKIKKPR